MLFDAAKIRYFFDMCNIWIKNNMRYLKDILLAQKKDIRLDVFGVLPGTRTLDPLIKSKELPD